MGDVFQWIWWISWGLSVCTVPSVLVQRAGRPSTALSWILALFVFPPVVLPAWWLVGRTHLKVRRRRRRLFKSIFEEKLKEKQRGTEDPEPASEVLRGITSLPDYLKSWVFPPTAGNYVQMYDCGENAFNAWEDAVREAAHHIHLLFYKWRDDTTGKRLRNALIAASRRGIEVRLLVDAIGTTAPRRFFKPLINAGGRVGWFFPMQFGSRPATINFRNHRKLVVIDGKEAFIGGMNVGDEYCAWVDLVVKIQGPGVDQIQEIFCDDWYYAVGEDLSDTRYYGHWAQQTEQLSGRSPCSCAVVAGGPHQRLNVIRETMMLAMSAATRRLWIMTPYFIPDVALTQTLRLARYRGVDVRLLVPAKNNWPLVRRASRAYYPELLDAGVHVYEFDGMLHAKLTVIDDNLVCIGSANLDERSFRLNFEMSCFLESCSLNAAAAEFCNSISARSSEIPADDFNKRSWLTRVVDAGFHIFSPVL
ncbi:MAG: cardiolipin synthase [Candidatus Latescibacteria bacterium]|nr:cardiolipin synthase [Candidatus Latescibacterota bacterium]